MLRDFVVRTRETCAMGNVGRTSPRNIPLAVTMKNDRHGSMSM